MPIRISKNRVSLENIPLNEAKGSDIASSGTLNLNNATGNLVHVTGTTTVTAITLSSGYERTVIFDGALTLTHNSSTLILPGNANITTVAGDRAIFRGDGTAVRCIAYVKENGTAVVSLSPFSSSFVSSEVTINSPTTGTYSVTHGLSGLPTMFQCVLRCKTAEYGYAVNDEIRIDSSGASTEYAGSVSINTSSITFKTLGTIQVNRLDTHAIGAITPGNWKIIFRCWK